MKIFDITRPIHGDMSIYPGNPPVSLLSTQAATAETSALTKIELGSHTGTHIDAPSHIKAGAPGIESYLLEQMIGTASVIDLSTVQSVITGSDLPTSLSDRLLIKTSNSTDGDIDVFNPEFVALDDSAAEKLVKSGLKLVGIDGPSIKKRGVKDQVHRLLLEAGVIIIEGLWLAHVPAGDYELLCLPLAVKGNGAPVRAILY